MLLILALNVLGDLTKEKADEVPFTAPLAPLFQILLIQVLHCPTDYTANIILFIAQHHHIQDFAKRGANQTLTFL